MAAFIAQNMAPIMFLALVFFLLQGYPVAFSLGAVGLLFFAVAKGPVLVLEGGTGKTRKIDPGYYPLLLSASFPVDTEAAAGGQISVEISTPSRDPTHWPKCRTAIWATAGRTGWRLMKNSTRHRVF